MPHLEPLERIEMALAAFEQRGPELRDPVEAAGAFATALQPLALRAAA